MESKQEIRVKHFKNRTDEIEYGTLIFSGVVSYAVIPDYNLSITKYWIKTNCELINTKELREE